MRTYEKTHAWLTFSVDLRRLSPRVWMLLGEAASKCEHIAGEHLRPDTRKQLHFLYLAKGVLATAAIEGNTLSEEQVLQHIEGKLKLPPSKEYLQREIDNILGALNQITREILENRLPALGADIVMGYNGSLLAGLELEDGVVPGETRKHSAGVPNYRGCPPEDCEYLLQRLCEWLNEFKAEESQAIVTAILKAILSHLYLVWIHPFGDGNGRTARLIESRILMEAGLPTPAVHLLSNHYNETRTEYYRQLTRASQAGGDPIPFIEYAIQGLVEQLRIQLERIRKQQWDVAWRSFVQERFRDRLSAAADRQRHLVLDLSQIDRSVPFNELLSITPRVAAEYATKTRKTLTRDVNALKAMDLLVETPTGFRPNKEALQTFLPIRATPRDKKL